MNAATIDMPAHIATPTTEPIKITDIPLVRVMTASANEAIVPLFDDGVDDTVADATDDGGLTVA